MKRLAVILILFTLCATANAQKKVIDSLKHAIAIAKDDTSRVILMSRLSRLYVYSKPDSALLLAQRNLQIAKKAEYPKGEAYSLSDIAAAFTVTGNYTKAISSSLSALKIAEKIKDLPAMEKCLHDIGLVYSFQGGNRQAVNYTLRAKIIAEAIHDERAVGIALLNLGDSYQSLNMLDSALFYSRLAHNPLIKSGDMDLIGTHWNNLGNVYLKMNRLDSAIVCYRKSFIILKQVDDADGFCETALGLAKIFQKRGLQDSALYYARQSIASGWHGGFTPRVLTASQFLTNYFKQQGRLDSAYRYLEVSVAAKDSLFSEQKTREIQNLEFSERQRQIDIQEKEAAYKASIRFYLLVGVTVFLLILAFFFWRNSKQRQKANELLQIQNREIEKQKKTAENALSELKTTQNQLVQSAKMASLGELTAGIAHEIQNPLNFVNNFSDVSTELVDEMNEELDKGDVAEAKVISADIKQNLEKIRHHGKRADFIVKGMLEHSRTSTGERQPTNINVLADEFLKLSYNGLRAKDKSFNAELVTNFDSSLPKVHVVQQDIGRVLINLFGNAFYAVNEKAKAAGPDYKPTVEVSTARQNGSIHISVKDNGSGIPDAIKDKIMQPFFTTKPTGDGTGLGLSLSYDIVVKGHGGSIDVDTKDGEFTEFTVSLPTSLV